MLLYELEEGAQAKIRSLGLEPSFASRLRDMGFCEGEAVTCIRIAAMKSPVIYRVKGTLVALRKRDAERVETDNE